MHITKSFFLFFREALLALGIGFLVPLISSYVVVLVHPQPERATFESKEFNNNEKQLQRLQTMQGKLEKLELALITSSDEADKIRLVNVRKDLDGVTQEYEHRSATHDKERQQIEQHYNAAHDSYAKVYFYGALVTSLLSFVISIASPLISLSVGFMIGGFSCLTTGYFKYWDQLSAPLKLCSLLLALMLIVGMSYYFFYGKKEDCDSY